MQGSGVAEFGSKVENEEMGFKIVVRVDAKTSSTTVQDAQSLDTTLKKSQVTTDERFSNADETLA